MQKRFSEYIAAMIFESNHTDEVSDLLKIAQSIGK